MSEGRERMLAQQQPPTPPSSGEWTLMGLVAFALTSLLAALLFYLKHLVTVHIPGMSKDYLDEVKASRDREDKIRAEFNAALKLVVDSCEQERKEYRLDVEKIREKALVELKNMKDALMAHRHEIVEIIRDRK